MRAALIFLAVVLAGHGLAAPVLADRAADLHAAPFHTAVLPVTELQAADAIMAAGSLEAAAAIRPGVPALAGGILVEGAGPAPRGLPRAIQPSSAPVDHQVAGRSTAFRAHSASCRTFTSRLALERAGRVAFHTTAPPPFRFV